MESFWGSLRNELVQHYRNATRAEAEDFIREYAELFYNRQRRHSRRGYLAPAVFSQFHRIQSAAARDASVHCSPDTSGNRCPDIWQSSFSGGQKLSAIFRHHEDVHWGNSLRPNIQAFKQGGVLGSN